MGTVWRIRLAAPAAFDPTPLRAAVEKRLGGLVAEMSQWERDSLLSRFNRARPGSWTALPPDFARVIAAALDMAERSGGTFDPTLGVLTDLFGFGPTPRSASPDPAALADALSHAGWRRLAFDRGASRLRQPGGLALDLSGIAKGYAVDALAALLAEHGHRHALIEVGGELAGRGLRPDGDPWWVELETPPGCTLPAVRVALHQLAVATSGDYVRGRHTLDPRTGQPVTEVTAASVLHPSAMLADAWASALTAAGFEAGAAMAEREGLAARLVRRDAPHEWLSPALEAML